MLPEGDAVSQSSQFKCRQTVLLGLKCERRARSGRITEMSLSGFRLQSSARFSIGMETWVMFPGFEGRRASVSWVRNRVAGCGFENPLHPTIFDHIIRMSEPHPQA